jgi:hypothetical protein
MYRRFVQRGHVPLLSLGFVEFLVSTLTSHKKLGVVPLKCLSFVYPAELTILAIENGEVYQVVVSHPRSNNSQQLSSVRRDSSS